MRGSKRTSKKNVVSKRSIVDESSEDVSSDEDEEDDPPKLIKHQITMKHLLDDIKIFAER
jgi:hypothetical protein